MLTKLIQYFHYFVSDFFQQNYFWGIKNIGWSQSSAFNRGCFSSQGGLLQQQKIGRKCIVDCGDLQVGIYSQGICMIQNYHNHISVLICTFTFFQQRTSGCFSTGISKKSDNDLFLKEQYVTGKFRLTKLMFKSCEEDRKPQNCQGRYHWSEVLEADGWRRGGVPLLCDAPDRKRWSLISDATLGIILILQGLLTHLGFQL